MCEIAKAISYHSKVIVLDEPTSSLTAPEVEKLSNDASVESTGNFTDLYFTQDGRDF